VKPKAGGEKSNQVPPPDCQEGIIFCSHAILSHPISDGIFLLKNKTDKTGATHKGGGGHARQGKENLRECEL
jgi:hypothetical protein